MCRLRKQCGEPTAEQQLSWLGMCGRCVNATAALTTAECACAMWTWAVCVFLGAGPGLMAGGPQDLALPVLGVGSHCD